MDKNKTAFPYMFTFPNGETEIQTGTTLRDYFANSAMQAITTNAGRNGYELSKKGLETIVRDSYKIADEMLKQREL